MYHAQYKYVLIMQVYIKSNNRIDDYLVSREETTLAINAHVADQEMQNELKVQDPPNSLNVIQEYCFVENIIPSNQQLISTDAER